MAEAGADRGALLNLEDEIAEENRRLKLLRTLVDLTSSVLCQGRLSLEQAFELVGATRRAALDLFPDKADTYDLILAPRFSRLMREFVPDGDKLLPFRRP